ncbi:MAG: putative sporulation protein YtxC [Peptostreptococcaceae bacterium]
MTNKEIHISFSPNHSMNAKELLYANRIKKEIDFRGDLIDVVINLDRNKEFNLEDVAKELTTLTMCIIKDSYLKEYVEKKFKESHDKEIEEIYFYSTIVFDRMKNIITETVEKKILTYLSGDDSLNIEGFLKFRLKEMFVYISSITDIAFEEYLAERDQNEFINVLKYFIDIQETKIDLLIVNILGNGSFEMYDSNGNKIDNIDNEEIINMIIKEDLNYEDFLISTLLTLCPKKIHILDSLNDKSSKVAIETIKSIFGDRVSIILKN